MPEVSICIPAYNAAPFIGQTLDSLLNQTFQEYVIIVSDNHSTDDTANIVKRYQKVDSRISLTTCPQSSENHSLKSISLSAIDNGNHLLSLAKTKYIALYHADDLYNKNILSEEVSFMQKHENASAVFTMGRLLDSDGKNVSKKHITLPTCLEGMNLFPYEKFLESLILYKMQILTPTCLMRRSAALDIGPLREDYEQASDYDYWLRLAKVGPIGVINKALLLRRVGQHQDSYRGRTLYQAEYLPAVRLFEEHTMALADEGKLKMRLMYEVNRIKALNEIRIANNYFIHDKTTEAHTRINKIHRDNCGYRVLMPYEKIYIMLLKIASIVGTEKSLVMFYMNIHNYVRKNKWKTEPMSHLHLE